MSLSNAPFKFTIKGHCQSKANSRRWTGRRMIKSASAMAFINGALPQMPKLEPLMEGPLIVSMTIYYPSMRNDLDESLVLDIMQGYIYKNDRQVMAKHVYRALDKENPRVEIAVSKTGKWSNAFAERVAERVSMITTWFVRWAND